MLIPRLTSLKIEDKLPSLFLRKGETVAYARPVPQSSQSGLVGFGPALLPPVEGLMCPSFAFISIFVPSWHSTFDGEGT